MVSPHIRRFGIGVVLLALLCGTAWILIPEVISCGVDPHKALVRNALFAYRAQAEQFPRSFLDVEQFLEISTRTDCRITQSTEDTYRVEMPLTSGTTYFMDVTYRVSADGNLESYHVRIVGNERS